MHSLSISYNQSVERRSLIMRLCFHFIRFQNLFAISRADTDTLINIDCLTREAMGNICVDETESN